jgi:hypothetical protein
MWIFPICSPTVQGTANVAELMGEELEEQGGGGYKRAKRCKPFVELRIFALQPKLWLDSIDRKWIYADY